MMFLWLSLMISMKNLLFDIVLGIYIEWLDCLLNYHCFTIMLLLLLLLSNLYCYSNYHYLYVYCYVFYYTWYIERLACLLHYRCFDKLSHPHFVHYCCYLFSFIILSCACVIILSIKQHSGSHFPRNHNFSLSLSQSSIFFIKYYHTDVAFNKQ